jgi:5S rRNA maturation endonuclease (ribonuclease M5)
MASLASLIKKKIEQGPGYEDFIRRYVDVEYINEQGEARFCCVAHEEDKSGCHFNTSTGLWKCFSGNCGAQGDVIDFFFYATKAKGKAEAIRQLAVDLKIIEDLSDDLIDGLEHALWSVPQILQRAEDDFGVTGETLKRYRIGFRFDPQTKEAHFCIPIRGESGAWEDIRRYNRKYEPKIKAWKTGHGGCRVFPIDVLRKHDALVVFEGEKDCMRAQEFGISNAISFTGGAGNLPETASQLFRDKIVYLCYDVDKAGIEGAEKVARRLSPIAKQVFVVRIPSENLPDNGDFSDWANLGRTMTDWKALLDDADEIRSLPGQRFDERPLENGEILDVEFRDILDNKGLYGKPIRFLARAVGSSVGLPNYQVPTKVMLDCPMNQKGLCKNCALQNWPADTKPWDSTIDYRTESSLRLFRCTDFQQNQAIRDVFGIHPKCTVVQIASTERQPVQHLLLSNSCELNMMREQYNGEFTAFYHGVPLTDNRDYWFTGYVQADPKTQATVLNIMTAQPARNAIETFTINEDTTEALEFFRPKPGVTIKEHLDWLHTLIEEDIGIWGQHPMQQAFLEAIFSVLKFKVGEREIDNGWVEILLIGDTGLAKSTVALRIMRMINIGEYLNGETVSAAGIIGGIEYRDKVAVMKWGAFPRNDQGFVVLDEVDAMQKRHKDVTGQLTAMRSTGIAKVTKIESAETPARVRTVWITNPQECKAIASFNGACRAISGIIENRADVARFTKAYAVANENVTVDTITQARQRHQHPIARKHWNTLAILTWSLKPDQVLFTPAAQHYLREQTKILTEKYHDSIPLLEKGRAMDKLAKLSIPIAVLCGSFREVNGLLTLIVDQVHCAYCIGHLQQTYDDQAMGYDNYSIVEYQRERIKNEDDVIESLEKGAVCGGDMEDILRFFTVYPNVNRNVFRELVGNIMAADEIWSCLLRNNCLMIGRSLDQASKTKAFAQLLERLSRREKERQTIRV